MTLTDAANELSRIGEEWIGANTDQTLEQVMLLAASQLSPDPIFNVAAFLKMDGGDAVRGMSDIEFIQTAVLISKVLENKYGRAIEDSSSRNQG